MIWKYKTSSLSMAAVMLKNVRTENDPSQYRCVFQKMPSAKNLFLSRIYVWAWLNEEARHDQTPFSSKNAWERIIS